MVRGDVTDQFSCVVMGDTQPYSNTEIGYVRDSIVTDLLAHDLSDFQCMMLVGDVMGDDLGLLPRFLDIMGSVGLPQYYVHGNHDYDFDATTDAHSGDSWRHLYGPTYYSYDIGQVHFIVLDNVVYPCTDEDNRIGGRDHCLDSADPDYNGRVTDTQMEWLANNLALVPEDRLIVLAHHIPFVSFIDSASPKHQTDNVREIYALLRGRPALSLSGPHAHAGAAAGRRLVRRLAGRGGRHPPAVRPRHRRGAVRQLVVGRLQRRRHSHVVRAPGARRAATWCSSSTATPTATPSTAPTWPPTGRCGCRSTRPGSATGSRPCTPGPMRTNRRRTRCRRSTSATWHDTNLFTPEELADGVFLVANVWNGSRDQ